MTEDLPSLIAGRIDEAHARLTLSEARLAQIRAARSGANDDDEHDPEGATLSAEWSRAEGQRADALEELARLETARERLADGTFGTCATCGRSIPRERLRLHPSATQCVPCAERG